MMAILHLYHRIRVGSTANIDSLKCLLVARRRKQNGEGAGASSKKRALWSSNASLASKGDYQQLRSSVGK